MDMEKQIGTVGDGNLAKLAYEAYGERAGWKTYDDKPMPQWDELGDAVRDRWYAATTAVVHQLMRDEVRRAPKPD